MRHRQKRLGGKRKLQLESKTFPVLLYKRSVRKESGVEGRKVSKK